jgi:hypothetical protein
VGGGARGPRPLGENVQKIEGKFELNQVRRQALRVNLKSLLSAVSLTIISVLLQ